MKADLRSQSRGSNFTRYLAGAAVAFALSAVVASGPAFADSDRHNSGGWGRGSDHQDGRNWGHQRGNAGGNRWGRGSDHQDGRNWGHQRGNHGGNNWGNYYGRLGYSQPYAYRHHRYPAHGWHANNYYSGRDYPWYGYGGGASITLNVPFR